MIGSRFLHVVAVTAALGLCLSDGGAARTGQGRPGVLLEDLTWVEADRVLKRDAVVVIPIGAEAKEHGPHLKLKTDFILAEYLKRKVAENGFRYQCDVRTGV